MTVKGPIILIENDADDRELLLAAFENLKLTNRLNVFETGKAALDYLNTTRENPFLILSEVKLPRMNGLELREQINNNPYLKKKSIPYIFLTETAEPHEVNKAYDLSVQGFFIKPNSLEALTDMLKLIINYWKACVEPGKVI